MPKKNAKAKAERKWPPVMGLPPDLREKFEESFARNEEALRRLAKL